MLKAAVVLVVAVDLKLVASMDADLDRAAVIPLGRPVKVLTRLKRKPVEEFAMLEKWSGPPLRSPRSRPNG